MTQNLPQSVSLGDFNNIIIRESTDGDVLSVVNAFSDYLEEIEHIPEQELTFSDSNVRLFRALVRESMSVHGIHPVVAEFNNKKIGFNFWIKISGFEGKQEIVHALGTYIRPEFRKIGLASIMSRISFEYLRSKGVSKVYGKVFESRESSSKYITELGFEKQIILCKTL